MNRILSPIHDGALSGAFNEWYHSKERDYYDELEEIGLRKVPYNILDEELSAKVYPLEEALCEPNFPDVEAQKIIKLPNVNSLNDRNKCFVLEHEMEKFKGLWELDPYQAQEDYCHTEKEAKAIAFNIGLEQYRKTVDYISPTLEPPKQRSELIKGILKHGHKMLLTGDSKAGKSFLLEELAVSIAYGKPWLNFECVQGNVLYINTEIDPISCWKRFEDIGRAMGITEEEKADCCRKLFLWTVEGCGETMEIFTAKILWYLKKMWEGAHKLKFDAVIIDPIYPLVDGNENDNTDMKNFFRYISIISARTGASVIYSHHHSKGYAAGKRMIDRGSGSGTFARFPDCFLDVTKLDDTDEMLEKRKDSNTTAWRMEGVSRHFPNLKPVDFWFEYPIHRVDDTGILAKADLEGSNAANLAKSGKRKAGENRKERFEAAFAMAMSIKSFEDGQPHKVSVAEITAQAGSSGQWVRSCLKDYSLDYVYDKKNSLAWYKSDNIPFEEEEAKAVKAATSKGKKAKSTTKKRAQTKAK